MRPRPIVVPTERDHGAPFDVPPAERRARDGAEGRRAGLVDHPARAVRELVGEPAQCRADPVDVAVCDVDGVGSRADDALQRRLPAQHPPCQAPVGPRPARERGVGGDLGGHRPAHRLGAGIRHRDVGRGPPAVPRAQRLPRGDLPHLLLQPAGRRRRRRGRDAVRGGRGDRPRAVGTADGHPARAGLRPGGDGLGAGDPRDRGAPARHEPARSPLLARLPVRRRADGTARHRGGHHSRRSR